MTKGWKGESARHALARKGIKTKVKKKEKIPYGYTKEDWEQNKATCMECGKTFYQDKDIQLCDTCMKKFDVEKLWKLHDANKLDALDFNESKQMREKFRIKTGRKKKSLKEKNPKMPTTLPRFKYKNRTYVIDQRLNEVRSFEFGKKPITLSGAKGNELIRKAMKSYGKKWREIPNY